MALKSSEARAQKRNKTKSVIIYSRAGDIQGSSSVLRGRRLFKVEKQFWRDRFWDVYGKRQDFHKISMWLGVHSKWWVQQQRKSWYCKDCWCWTAHSDILQIPRVGWMKWKEVSGVMCDRKMPVELKDKVCKTIIGPAMTYGSECWAVKKKDENKLNSAEMGMLRWARGKTRLDHIRKEAHVKPVETFLENKRLKWFGHCLRREHNHICAKSLRLEVSGGKSRGRPKKRWRDNIQGDMKKYQLTEDMEQDRKYWMTKILAGPAQGDGQKRWERLQQFQ